MKQLPHRSAGLARHTAPSWGELHDIEVVPLRMLQPWLRWLYFELVMLSDFGTGLVNVHRAKLLALLDCDQPESGPRLDVVSTKQLRDGLQTLSDTGFVRYDSKKNTRAKALEIWVVARRELRSAGDKQGREQGRPRTPLKPSNGAGSGASYPPNRADNRAGGSNTHSLSVGSLSVDNSEADLLDVERNAKRAKQRQEAEERRGDCQAPLGKPIGDELAKLKLLRNALAASRGKTKN